MRQLVHETSMPRGSANLGLWQRCETSHRRDEDATEVTGNTASPSAGSRVTTADKQSRTAVGVVLCSINGR